MQTFSSLKRRQKLAMDLDILQELPSSSRSAGDFNIIGPNELSIIMPRIPPYVETRMHPPQTLGRLSRHHHNRFLTHGTTDLQNMSTSLDDLEQYSAMDLDPLQGLHRPSPPPIEEQPSDTENEEPAGDIIAYGIPSLSQQSSPNASQGDIVSKISSPRKQAGRPKRNRSFFASYSASEEREWEEELCHAIKDDKWSKVEEIMDQNRPQDDLRTTAYYIRSKGKTTLHLAAQYGSITIVEELLRQVSPQFLLDKDCEGYTALALASWYNGNTQIAKLLVAKNPDILTIADSANRLPVTISFANNFQELGRYLYHLTPFETLEGHPVATLICNCLQLQCLDIALDLLQNRQELLFMSDRSYVKELVPVHKIATLNTTILSPTELTFWKRWIYKRLNIPSITSIKHVSVDIQQEHSCQQDQAKMIESGHGLLQRFINSITNFEGVKKIQELKQLHAQVDALNLLVCKNSRKESALDDISEALRLAAKEGNVEFVLQVSKGIREVDLGPLMFVCFSEALEYRQAKVFNLIHGFRYKAILRTTILDIDDPTTLLHKVAKSAPDHVLNRIYAPALQIQRELQWFKEVESLMPPSYWAFQNKDGFTAKELFRKSHKKLMNEGEKWIKDTASSCSLVGTLIVTIMFAAAFTVPGGNDQNLGYPLFIKQPFFKVFIFSTILSFLSSSTSVLIFLAILTSQYSEEKFLKSLPTKLIFGIFFLFLSILSMIAAFLCTTYLMLKHTHYVWGLLPFLILASLPILLFVLSQLPLLYHTYKSTYGKIFDRNVKPWP